MKQCEKEISTLWGWKSSVWRLYPSWALGKDNWEAVGEAQSGTGGKLLLVLSWAQCTTIRTTLLCSCPGYWDPYHTHSPCAQLGSTGMQALLQNTPQQPGCCILMVLRCARGRDSLGWGTRADRQTAGGGGQMDTSSLCSSWSRL